MSIEYIPFENQGLYLGIEPGDIVVCISPSHKVMIRDDLLPLLHYILIHLLENREKQLRLLKFLVLQI